MRRRRLVDRGVEIVAQRRAKRGLIAARDAQGVDHAEPGAARVGAEEARERPRLGLQLLRGPLGFRQRPAALRLDLSRRGVALFGGQHFALSGCERFNGIRDGLSARGVLPLVEARRAERRALMLDSGIFRLQPREAAPLLFERGEQRPATRGKIGRGGLRLRERALGDGEAALGAVLRVARPRGIVIGLRRPAPQAWRPRPRAFP